MKRMPLLILAAIGALLFAAPGTYLHPKAQQEGAPGPDSIARYCKKVFSNNCAGCHGEKGQGVVGPNLTDIYWLHGGGVKNVTKTVRDGVGGKGMISWDAVFSPQEIQYIAEYVVSLQGTDPPKAKKPEGEPLKF